MLKRQLAAQFIEREMQLLHICHPDTVVYKGKKLLCIHFTASFFFLIFRLIKCHGEFFQKFCKIFRKLLRWGILLIGRLRWQAATFHKGMYPVVT